MTTIERVAKALYDAEAERSPISAASFNEMQVLSPDKYLYWRGIAKVAIETMYEPTDAMEIAGGAAAPDQVTNGDCREIFKAMIDAALTEDHSR